MTLNDISERYGLEDEERRIFAEYTGNRFAEAEEADVQDTGFLAPWYKILDYAGLFGVEKAINDKLLSKRPVDFRSPDTLSIEIYDSFAGKIPVIYVRDTQDFEQLVTNIAYKGVRPEGLSTTGASFISGKTTRFILLSAKPYSNVPAAELGLPDEAEWEEKSLILRRGHECTHYFTKQNYGISNNLLHDEIMADFIGMQEAFGFYKAEWFLRFMGIIEGSGGRLSFYTNALPERVRSAVSELARCASYGLEAWSKREDFLSMTTGERIRAMCLAGLEGMCNLSNV